MLRYVDRRGTNCVKWDAISPAAKFDDTISMSIADMDFSAPDCVRDALRAYADMGALGYYKTPDGYVDSFLAWEKAYHMYEVKREWVRFSPGVVPAFHWLAQLMVSPGDGIIVMPPVYGPFFSAVKAANAREVDCPLVLNGNRWEVDFDAFERAAAEPSCKLFILCSPHNPAGRVWTRAELVRMLDICREHGVRVIADEIHQDLILTDRPQYAAAGLGDYADMVVTLTAASKTFNIASCQNSFAVIPDDELRARFDGMQQAAHSSGGNAFGYIATEAAYRGGREWLDELIDCVRGNFAALKGILQEGAPGIRVTELEGTYLAWIDLADVLRGRTVAEFVARDCHIACNGGDWFGGEAYATYARLNLATGRDVVREAAERIVRAARAM